MLANLVSSRAQPFSILREIIQEVSCKTRPPLGAAYSLMGRALRERGLQRATCLPAVGLVCGVVPDGWVRIRGLHVGQGSGAKLT